MVVADTKVISAVTQVYDSSEAKGFAESEQYPIAWEIIFVNDAVGKEFADNAVIALTKTPKEKACLLGFEGDALESARCFECAFKDRDSFRQFLKASMPNLVIYDEQQSKVIPKQILLDNAREIALQTETAISGNF